MEVRPPRVVAQVVAGATWRQPQRVEDAVRVVTAAAEVSRAKTETRRQLPQRPPQPGRQGGRLTRVVDACVGSG